MAEVNEIMYEKKYNGIEKDISRVVFNGTEVKLEHGTKSGYRAGRWHLRRCV